MAKRGPKGPSLNLDLSLIEKLAAIHCNNKEIASTVGCDPSLLSKRNYSIIIQKGKERGKASLRKKMWETAHGGNVSMMIWLSKQYLGMSEKIEEKKDGTLIIEHVYKAKLGKKVDPQSDK